MLTFSPRFAPVDPKKTLHILIDSGVLFRAAIRALAMALQAKPRTLGHSQQVHDKYLVDSMQGIVNDLRAVFGDSCRIEIIQDNPDGTRPKVKEKTLEARFTKKKIKESIEWKEDHINDSKKAKSLPVAITERWEVQTKYAKEGAPADATDWAVTSLEETNLSKQVRLAPSSLKTELTNLLTGFRVRYGNHGAS